MTVYRIICARTTQDVTTFLESMTERKYRSEAIVVDTHGTPSCPVLHVFDCMYCHDKFGVVELPESNTKLSTYKNLIKKLEYRWALPISWIDPSYRRQYQGTTGTHDVHIFIDNKSIWQKAKWEFLGRVDRWDSRGRKEAEQIKANILELLNDERSKKIIEEVWENNMLFTEKTRFNALRFIAQNGGSATEHEISEELLKHHNWDRNFWLRGEIAQMLREMADENLIEILKNRFFDPLEVKLKKD